MKVRVEIFECGLTKCLASFLSCIHSAPELSSITLSLTGTGPTLQEFSPSGNWVAVDEWLARMAAMRGKVGNGLMVVLAGWPEGNMDWRKYFPEFRRAGGELRGEIHDDYHWDPRMIMGAHRWKNPKCDEDHLPQYV